MAQAAAPDLGAAPRGGVWGRLTLHQKQVVWAWTFLAIPIVFYVVIRFWPTLEAFWLSFTNWNLLRQPAFVGFENYKRLPATPCSGRFFATPSSTSSSARR
jgi:multiple sugar transport system permease protein